VKTIFLKSELLKELQAYRANGKTIGLVPTMGALHNGHASLVKQCAEENDVVVVSIFVNPTQFNDEEDLIAYPRDLNTDEGILNQLVPNPVVIFAPEVSEIYEQQVQSTSFDFQGLDKVMEGEFRPGHFDGVATVVSKLFNIVRPHKAYFGQKDYQQLLIVKKMVEALQLPVIIRPCKIFRENDGLAMSSRNQRLTQAQRSVAPLIYKVLRSAKLNFGTKSVKEISDWTTKQFDNEPLLDLEYFTIADAETLQPITDIEINKTYRVFIAVFAGEVRLIDNMALN